MAFSGNALCNSFKQELLEGVHNFKATGGNTFKLAMYTNSQAGSELGGTSSTMEATVTAYSSSASNEVSSSGYSAGGGALTNVAPSLKSTSTATTQFSPLTFSGVTLTAR